MIKAFVKKNCAKCELFKNQYLPKIKDVHKVKLFDLDTVDGMTEAAYYDVQMTPTLISVDDKDVVIKRWASMLEAVKELEVKNA